MIGVSPECVPCFLRQAEGDIVILDGAAAA
jgi:hypothetical protein